MILYYNEKQFNFPDFIIVGAARSGTTYLYRVLSEHPQVFMPEEKEPQFFCDYETLGRKTISGGKIVRNWQNYNINQYSALFQKAKREQLWGEASVDYLYEYQTTINNIKRIYQENAEKLKLIVILRNPADRAWSHYLLRATKNSEVLPFAEAIKPEIITRRLEAGMISTFDYIGYGLYADKVKAWQKNFPCIKIWIYEEFFNNLEHYMSELTGFLEIDNLDAYRIPLGRINASGVANNKVAQFFVNRLQNPAGWKKPFKLFLPQRWRQKVKKQATQKISRRQNIDSVNYRQLMDFYYDDIKQLETVLNRDLEVWLKADDAENSRCHS